MSLPGPLYPQRRPRPERIREHRIGDRREARPTFGARRVYGMVRCMTLESTARKFDSAAYIGWAEAPG